MLMVREVMTPDPVTVEPELSLRMTADLLTEAGVGGAPVVRGGRVVGVVSLTDIVSFEADDPGVPTFRPELQGPLEEDILQSPELLDEPARWFVEMWEDLPGDVVSRMGETEGPEWDTLDEHTVGEVMSSEVLWIAPGASLRDAARVMVRARVHRLLVVDGGELVGILTSWDVVRAVAEGVVEA